MKRNQTFHEILIPLLVEGIGAESYLEFGTHLNETIGKVKCPLRYGVDTNAIAAHGIQAFQMTTTEFIEKYAAENAPYDVVFIDADHTAESARSDFMGIWPFVSPDGLILAHDVNPETVSDTAPGFCGDSWTFAHWLFESQDYEGVVLPYHPGLLIVRKRSQWGPVR